MQHNKCKVNISVVLQKRSLGTFILLIQLEKYKHRLMTHSLRIRLLQLQDSQKTLKTQMRTRNQTLDSLRFRVCVCGAARWHKGGRQEGEEPETGGFLRTNLFSFSSVRRRRRDDGRWRCDEDVFH